MILGRPEAGDRIPKEWRPAERYITKCARCGTEILKQNSVHVYVKKPGHCELRILLHFCVTCYTYFLDDYGIPEA